MHDIYVAGLYIHEIITRWRDETFRNLKQGGGLRRGLFISNIGSQTD